MREPLAGLVYSVLIAQAQIEGLTVVSRDAALRAYEIQILPA
jgi:PIN domain nuclease of toxin-antitoxin system